jgi:transcriptional regulator with XRE-family HTH domain
MTAPLIQKIWTDKVHAVADHKKWTGGYPGGMEADRRDRLAHTGDTGLEAVAIRLRAARDLAGAQQAEIATEIGTKKGTISNAENGLNYPSVALMRYYYRMHRLDFNFLMNGDWAQLPASMQERLFAALEAANDGWDRTPRSSQRRASRAAAQPAT